MKLVVIESPYAGDVAENLRYARACLLDSLRRGEAPIASHLLYTQVLDDLLPDERKLGIEAGLAWCHKADIQAFYVDLGWSKGMKDAKSRNLGPAHEIRYVSDWVASNLIGHVVEWQPEVMPAWSGGYAERGFIGIVSDVRNVAGLILVTAENIERQSISDKPSNWKILKNTHSTY